MFPFFLGHRFIYLFFFLLLLKLKITRRPTKIINNRHHYHWPRFIYFVLDVALFYYLWHSIFCLFVWPLSSQFFWWCSGYIRHLQLSTSHMSQDFTGNVFILMTCMRHRFQDQVKPLELCIAYVYSAKQVDNNVEWIHMSGS